jgi:hypothetical protein
VRRRLVITDELVVFGVGFELDVVWVPVTEPRGDVEQVALVEARNRFDQSIRWFTHCRRTSLTLI